MITKVEIPKVSLWDSAKKSSAKPVEPADVVPAYTLTCSESVFIQGEEYTLTVSRVTAPNKQTQIEIYCEGGKVSPAFLVDEGEPYVLEDANSKILVTPTEETCRVILKCTVGGKEYSVGKFTMKCESDGTDYESDDVPMYGMSAKGTFNVGNPIQVTIQRMPPDYATANLRLNITTDNGIVSPDSILDRAGIGDLSFQVTPRYSGSATLRLNYKVSGTSYSTSYTINGIED